MKIAENCAVLLTRVDRIIEGREQAAEIISLSQRLTEAEHMVEVTAKVRDSAIFLKENKVTIKTSEINVNNALKYISKIIDRFIKKPDSASLTMGKDWTKLQEETNRIIDDGQKSILNSWKSHIDALKPGQSPKELTGALAKTNKNNRALKGYTNLYSQLVGLRDGFPDESNEIDRASRLSVELRQLSKSFDYDVPDNVKMFLSAIDQGGASLKLLTPEVIKWLDENSASDSYQIIGKGQ